LILLRLVPSPKSPRFTLEDPVSGHCRLGLTQSSDELTFASNQIFKDLRNLPAIRLKKTEAIAGLEGVLAQAILTILRTA
jgi:hypothetical protein